MRMTAKISQGQLLCLLLICRIADLMTFVPLIREGYSFKAYCTAALISTVVQALLVIPLIIFSHRYKEQTVTGAICQKNRTAGVIAAALYLVFFLIGAVNGIAGFMRYLNSRFFSDTGYGIMLAVFCAVCIYCAHCGIEGLARSSLFVLIFFLAVIAVMAASSAGNYRSDNFYGSVFPDSLPKAVIADLARNSEIAAAAFLVKNTYGNCRRSLYGLLGAKLVLTGAVMAMITGVLGGYALLTDYPLMEVGSYSETRLFQRNDALYLIAWTLAAVISVSVFIRISAGLAREIFPRLKRCCAVTGAVSAGAALFMLENGLRIGQGADIVTGVLAAVLTGIIPLVLCLCGRKEGAE